MTSDGRRSSSRHDAPAVCDGAGEGTHGSMNTRSIAVIALIIAVIVLLIILL